MPKLSEEFMERSLTHYELESFMYHARFCTTLLSPPLEGMLPSHRKPWNVSHAIVGIQGEMLELTEEGINLAATIKEFGDLIYYLGIIIENVPAANLAFRNLLPKDCTFLFQEYRERDYLIRLVEQLGDKLKKVVYYGQDVDCVVIAQHVYAILWTIKSQYLTAITTASLILSGLRDTKPQRVNYFIEKVFDGDDSYLADPKDLSAIINFNRQKLEKRYPNGRFTTQDSIERKDTTSPTPSLPEVP